MFVNDAFDFSGEDEKSKKAKKKKKQERKVRKLDSEFKVS